MSRSAGYTGFQTCGSANFQIGTASKSCDVRGFGYPRFSRLGSLRYRIAGEISRLRVLLARCFSGIALVLLAAALTGCGARNHSEHVELVMGSAVPTPATTFELRFESVMVKGDQVGLPAKNSPLVIKPPLAGTFAWLSSRSGVFTPAEPLAFNTRYQLELHPGLCCVDGQPSAAKLRWTVTTPPFGLIATWPQQADTNANSEPVCKLAFNADVRAADVGRFFSFRDQAGRRIPAEVRQGTGEDLYGSYEFGSVHTLRTWQQDAAAVNRPAKEFPETAAPESPTNELPNLLIIAPQDPLPLGKGWRLVVAKGIPTRDGSWHSSAPADLPIGDITPFVVQEIAAHDYLNAGPSVQLEFSKPIPETLTNDFRDWIEFSPVPTDLTAQVSNRRLTFQGDFQGGTSYLLKLRPGFPAVEPFTLHGANTFTVELPHVAARLYFPAFSRDQLAAGNRSFPLLSINVARMRVRAKLMDPHTAIHALRGYGSYFATAKDRRENDDGDEPYRMIDYNLVPGNTVFDQEFDLGADAADSDQAHTRDLAWDQLLGGRRTGVVFLDARRIDHDDQDPDLGTQALIQLTDLGLVWKQAPTGVEVFAFSHQTGQPVTNATARLFSDENQLLREALTDTNGVAHLDVNTNAAWVAVQAGDDFHAVVLDQNRIWPYRFELPYTPVGEAEDPRRVLLFSDRDLYRPGETMHLEAIVRTWGIQGLTIPIGTTGTLQCVDARDQRFFQTNIVFTSLGSCSTLVPLPTTSRGSYTATLHFGTNDSSPDDLSREENRHDDYHYAFLVEDFKPSAFEIQLPCQEEYAAGEPIRLPLSARYLFGKAVSRAKIVWSLAADDTDFQPEKFPGFRFRRSHFESRYGRGQSSITLSDRGALTGTSNFIVAPNLSFNPVAPQPRTVSLLVEVTDVNQQTLSHRAEFVQHSSDFYLGLRQAAGVLTAGTAPSIEAVAVGVDGKPWPEIVKAQLSLQRVDWQSVRVQGAGKSVRFHNEQVFTNLLETEITVAPVAVTDASADQTNGIPLTDLPPLAAGEYLLEIKAQDAGGRPVISSLDFQVTAPAEMGRNYKDDVRLTLKSDHESYVPGDLAEILVEAPFSGTALVTVEREKVLRSFVTQLEGNAPSIRVPLEPGDVPNVFVSVTLVRGSDQSPHRLKEPEYRVGSCELPVLDPRTRLGVKIVAASTNCLPGRPVDVTVQVTDAAGLPVSGAEVVLYAVDDGILGLTDYKLPDPHGFFYAARPLGVQTSVSLPNLLPEDPEDLQFENKGYLGGGGGQDRIRKNFLACAFWNATLSTDPDGKAHVQFPAPDSLTRYRLLAVAHTAESHFGSGQSAFHVTKPLVIEPSLPAFANITDHLLARGLILNQTTNSGDVLVTLELDHKTKASGPEPALSRRVSVAANGSMPVEFPVEFLDTGEAKWVWRAHFVDAAAGNFVDAVQSTIAIGHLAPQMGEVLLGRVHGSPTNLLALANPQLLAGKGRLTVDVGNTRLSELGETASQLLQYPYGCAEQTGSSLLPWILLRDAPGLLPARRLGTNNAASAIRAGVARLFSMQTPSGGLGYWPREKEPMLWASAYGGMVLALAQRHGVSVPKNEFASLLNYLSAQLRSPTEEDDDLSDECLGLYALALAGKAEPGYQEKLYSLRGKLSAEDRALLALAIAENQGPREMVDDLIGAGSPARSGDEGRFGCPARAEAIRLLAWIQYSPEAATVDRLVSDLLREQKQAHWETTQGNAWGLLALTEYARQVEAKLQPAEGQLQYAGQSVSFQLNDRTNVFSQSFSITNVADASLLVLTASTNRLYTTVTLEARPPETPQPRQDRGFSLQRRYDRLDDDNQPQGPGNWHVGDRVLVTLRLTVREPARYVVIDDALPAVLEAINPEFRTQAARSGGAPGEEGSWWPSDFREIRQDRCLSFADSVAPGTYVLQYLARVRAAGTVTAPSAKVEEMYHPERCGLTETQTLVSEPLP